MIQSVARPTYAQSELGDLPPSSLIICSRNRPGLLGETVASILEGDEVPAELIVVDQSDSSHPTLGRLDIVRPCQIRYLWRKSAGVCQGRNVGIAAATHPLLAFTDDDMFAAPTWYGSLIRALLREGPRSVITGRVLAADEQPDGFVAAVHAWEEPHVYEGRIGRDILATGHMAMYRAAFEEVGGFDERIGPGTRFPGAEDNDYGFRLLEAGYRIIYEPDAVLYHRAWKSNRDYVALFWQYGRGQGAFYAKHLNIRDLYMLRRVGKDTSRYLRLLPRRLAKLQRLELLGATAFLLGIISGGAEWLLVRRGRGA